MVRARKCLKAVFRPEAFPAFTRVADESALRRLWQSAPHAVLANLAHLAYHREPAIREVLERLGAEVLVVNVNDAQAVLAAWPQHAVLAFRGTASWRDHVADCDVVRVRDDEEDGAARVHRGIRGRLAHLWEDPLRPALCGLGLPTWATGHSLGGAMAHLTGRRYPFQEVVTFGEPRGGTGLEAGFQAARHVRYVNRRDTVPLLPQRFLGYEHHGDAIELVDPDGPSWRYDHAIVYYAEILEMLEGG